jgi:hypothetical protein
MPMPVSLTQKCSSTWPARFVHLLDGDDDLALAR